MYTNSNNRVKIRKNKPITAYYISPKNKLKINNHKCKIFYGIKIKLI